MINDLTGKKIGLFEVIGDSKQRQKPSGGVLWIVKCPHCNNNRLLTKQQMIRYQSCGCITKDLLSKSLRKGGCGEIYGTHWHGIEWNAKQRKLPFNITVEYAWNLFLQQNRKCALTGVDLQFSKRCWPKTDATASLDRIDSSKGYIKGNVQWVHKHINMMKQEYEIEKFFDWCKKICTYNKLIK